MHKDYSEIFQFIVETNEHKSILLVECDEIASTVQKKMPNAKVYIGKMKSFNDGEVQFKADLYNTINMKTFFVDANSLDYIVLGGCFFEKEKISSEFLRQLLNYLKLDGEFIGSFNNSYHWSNLQEYKPGQWKYKLGNKQLFSLEEIAQLFEQVKCKEIQFSLNLKEAPSGLVSALQQEGFSNENGKLEVLRWGLCATRVNKKALMLKNYFDEKTRLKMAFLLRRIENQINVDENCAELWQLLVIQKVSTAYIVSFAMNTMLHSEKCITLLAIYLYERGNIIFALDLLRDGYHANEASDLIIHTFSSLLYLRKEWSEIKQILSQYEGSDKDILYLKNQMCGEKNEKQ